MTFQSIDYLLFLPTVVAIYFIVAPRKRWMVLLAFSYFFYGAWRIEFLGLLIASTLVDYFVALKMASESCSKRRKHYLWISLAVNLGALFTFKYFALFANNSLYALNWVGVAPQITPLHIILPIGISFYTFQTLSYTLDVYNRRREPESHLGIFAVYVSFFPQLLAGPIERSTTLLPQLRVTQTFSVARAVSGTTLILVGFFKKLVIADRLAIYHERIFAFPGDYSGAQLLLAPPAFTYQFYCDVSGYADIAIGSALILGITLTRNFNRPFAQRTIASFFANWHITVTRWFGDYVMKPLMMRNSSFSNRLYAMVVTIVLIVLWHGATWSWLLFGLIVTICFVAEHLIVRWYRKGAGKRQSMTSNPILRYTLSFSRILTGHVYVLVLTLFVLGILIGHESPETLFLHVQRLDLVKLSDFRPSQLARGTQFYSGDVWILLVSIAALEILQWRNAKASLTETINRQSTFVRWMGYYIVVIIILMIGVLNRPEFLYFQF